MPIDPQQREARTPAPQAVAVLPDALDATDGAETPFGHRWGGDVFRLTPADLAALHAGQTLALDVQNEYIVFLKCAEPAKPASNANVEGLENGG